MKRLMVEEPEKVEEVDSDESSVKEVVLVNKGTKKPDPILRRKGIM